LQAGRMGVWEWNILTGAVTWSETLEALHGLAPGTFANSFDAYLSDAHPEDRDLVLQSVRRAVEEGSDHTLEYRIVWPDGTIRWVEGKGRTLYDSTGEAVPMIGMCMDITERKQGEQERARALEALQESEARYRRLVETAEEGVWVIDAENWTTFVNDKMAWMLGYHVEEMLGRPLFAFMDAEGRALAQVNLERRRNGIREQPRPCFVSGRFGTRSPSSRHCSGRRSGGVDAPGGSPGRVLASC
jgi:PAS domain S-box-containing protein